MAAIDQKVFAKWCLDVVSQPQFGGNAHYLIAVAMLQSKITDDTVNNQVGPYRWMQAQWNANPDLTNAKLGVDTFEPADISDWRAQVAVLALNTLTDIKDLGGTPSALQLYQKQFPGAADPPLSDNFQKACNDTKQAYVDAVNAKFGDTDAAAPAVTGPKTPVATKPTAPGGATVAGGGGQGTGG